MMGQRGRSHCSNKVLLYPKKELSLQRSEKTAREMGKFLGCGNRQGKREVVQLHFQREILLKEHLPVI